MPRLADLALPDPIEEGTGLWGHWAAENVRRGGLVLLGSEEAAEGFAQAGYEVWQLAVPDGSSGLERASAVLSAVLSGLEGPLFLVGHGAAGAWVWALARAGSGLTAAAVFGSFLPDTDPPDLPIVLHLDDTGLDAEIEALQTRLPDLRVHRLSAGADLARLRTLAVFSRATGRGEGA